MNFGVSCIFWFCVGRDLAMGNCLVQGECQLSGSEWEQTRGTTASKEVEERYILLP
jgi:hypothetical protein